MTGAPYVRFDLLFDGDVQDLGFIQGLCETRLSAKEIAKLVSPFNEHLSIPTICLEGKQQEFHYPACYFTQKGYVHFKKHIERIIKMLDKVDCEYSVRMTTLESVPEDHLYFEDEYQAVIRKSYECVPTIVLQPA